MKNLVFFYPTIYNDGLKKTLELYTKYLNKNFKVVVVTNTLNSQNLKFANSKVKVINVKNAFLSKIKSVNEIIKDVVPNWLNETLRYALKRYVNETLNKESQHNHFSDGEENDGCYNPALKYLASQKKDVIFKYK